MLKRLLLTMASKCSFKLKLKALTMAQKLFLIPKQCTYFAFALQMALLRFFSYHLTQRPGFKVMTV